MNISPPGGFPYHPKEMGCCNDPSKDVAAVEIKTALYGIWLLILCTWWAIMVLVISSPFLLLGVAEVVAAGPSNYRVRWIRKEPS